MSNFLGQSLGRYHILEQLGEGGMATVYKAFDTRLESDVAVKVIRTERFTPEVLARALKRFEREAKALARLTHPNIVKVIDFGEHEGQPYLVMPFLSGGNLKERLKQHGAMPWPEAARLLLPIAQALDFAHNQNVIHRDIKPANILLTQNGQPMLTDFGVAKVVEEEATVDLTGTAMTVGTPEYMAPEQVTSKGVDHRADIYSLGVVFYELVTGRKPYVADTPLAVLIMQARDPLPRPKQFAPTLPDKVEQIILKALAKKPEDRYQSMGEFAVALERCLAEATMDQRRTKSVHAMGKAARDAVVPTRLEKAHLKQETPPIVTQPPGTSTFEEPLKLQPETGVRGISGKRMVLISGVVVLASILCVGAVFLTVLAASGGNILAVFAPPTATIETTTAPTAAPIYTPTLLSVPMIPRGLSIPTPMRWTAPPAMTIDPKVIYIATFQTARGEFRLQLFADKAPRTVNNFVFLARQGFYNNTTFHRVFEGFMAQGGDPTGTGQGGPGYSFEDEILPDLKFDQEGLLAMANSGPNTNGSQFFITHGPTPWLDGLHTIFGKVVSGMDVVLSFTPRDPDASPTFPGDAILSVTISESPVSQIPPPTPAPSD